MKQLKLNYLGRFIQIWSANFEFYIKSVEILKNFVFFQKKSQCFNSFAVRVIKRICRSVKLCVFVCQNQINFIIY